MTEFFNYFIIFFDFKTLIIESNDVNENQKKINTWSRLSDFSIWSKYSGRKFRDHLDEFVEDLLTSQVENLKKNILYS